MIKVSNLASNKIIQWLSITLLFVFCFILRAHNYDRTPASGNLEEMAYGWQGIYLIEDRVPVSWSSWNNGIYPKWAEIYRGVVTSNGGEPKSSVTMFKPYLDQPPLFGLMAGGVAHLYKADKQFLLPSSYIRLPSIYISLITMILIFMIVKYISGFWTGLLAVLIYSTTPIFVFASRMAVPENLISMFFLITIYLLLKFEVKPKLIYLLPIPLLAGLSGLSKAPGFFITPFAMYYAFAKGWYKSTAYLILATLPFIALFFAYGMYFNSEIFFHLQSLQSMRPIGFGALGWFLISPAYDIDIFNDGWYLFCILCAFFFLFQDEDSKKRLISLAFVYWLVILIISGGEGDLLPWYRFPAYPLLAMFGTWGFLHLYKRADFFASFIIVGLLLYPRHLLVNDFRSNIAPFSFRLIFSSLLMPSLFYGIFHKKYLLKISQLILALVFISGVYMNSIYIYNAFELKCESRHCPIGPATKESSLYFPVVWRLFTLGEPSRR